MTLHPHLLRRLGIGLSGLGLVIAVAIGFVRSDPPERSAADEARLVEPDPLSAELRRCATLPHKDAMEDQACQRAWVLNRQRFFGGSQELLEDPASTPTPDSED